MIRIALVASTALVIVIAGWTAFQSAAPADRIPGRASAFTLMPQQGPESSNALTFAVIGDAGQAAETSFGSPKRWS